MGWAGQGLEIVRVCSTVARVYDPLRLFALAVVHTKMFLKSFWQSKLEWNHVLPSSLHEDWQKIFLFLDSLIHKSVLHLVLVIEIHDSTVPVSTSEQLEIAFPTFWCSTINRVHTYWWCTRKQNCQCGSCGTRKMDHWKIFLVG